MALDPANPNVLYLTLYGEGLFRSTDAGLTWAEVLGAGLPQSDIGRGAVTIAASDPDRMYRRTPTRTAIARAAERSGAR